MNHKRPSVLLGELLSGKTRWEDADPTIQNWAQFEIYRAAIEVLAQPKEKRDTIFNRIPPDIRERVKSEANRVWRWRKAAA